VALGAVLVHVGIVLPDVISPISVELDGEDIILTTSERRTKANVLRLGSTVSAPVCDHIGMLLCRDD